MRTFALLATRDRNLATVYISAGWYVIRGLYVRWHLVDRERRWKHRKQAKNAGRSRRNFPVFLQEHGGTPGGLVQLRAAEEVPSRSAIKIHVDIVAIDEGLCFARFKTFYSDLPTGELCCFIDRGLYFMRRWGTLGRDVNPEDIASFGARKEDGGFPEEKALHY